MKKPLEAVPLPVSAEPFSQSPSPTISFAPLSYHARLWNTRCSINYHCKYKNSHQPK